MKSKLGRAFSERVAAQALELPEQEYCREWLADPWDRCGERAVVILWGKLFPAEALGPRCENHASKHCNGRSVNEIVRGGWAVYDLRPVNRLRGD